MEVFTIGYAGLNKDKICDILKSHDIQAIADVRSSPYSKTFPDFSKEHLKTWLQEKGIRYVYLGLELGPRSHVESHYIGDQVQFDILSKTELFQTGMRRLRNGSETMKIAIMCAENDPMTCHRSLLVAEYGKGSDLTFTHILKNGSLETHQAMMIRAMKTHNIAPDMFTSHEDCLKITHEKLCRKFAYKKITRAHEQGVPR